jgi:hypothetical protein
VNEELIDDFNDELSSNNPSGNDKETGINRYIISYPYEGEMKISEQKSSKLFPFLPTIIFGGMGGFFGFLTVHYRIEEPFHPSTIMCFCFFLFMGGLAAWIIVEHYSNARTYTFEKDVFQYKGLIWGKKTIARDRIESVFILESITRTQGSSDVNYRFNINLKVPTMTQFKKGYPICDLELKNSWKTAFGGADYKANDRAQAEAKHICELIAKHWTIPVSV